MAQLEDAAGGPTDGVWQSQNHRTGVRTAVGADLPLQLRTEASTPPIMPVLLLKEKVANTVGVPVGQQRLIFRGKVLKDDQLLSAYHVEDGHTLHLVARQPVQNESQPGISSAGTAGNVDNRGSAGAPRNRVGVVGQIAHNVVLGPFNIGDQSEMVIPDLSRIIGAVLNSLGIGAPATTGGVGNSPSTDPPNSSNQGSQTVETNGMQNASVRAPTEDQLPFSSNLFPFQSLNQSQPFHLVTPDSLITLSTFISRLEQALSLTGYHSTAANSGEDSLRFNMPSSSISGLPTVELLGTVIERAQRLLSGQATAALSHISGQLGRDGSFTDPAIRGQIQSQAMHVGVAMQHLGALLLELGRTILMLRMGQTPAESSVNAGPAVYISASGPSPMMVQPALHTSPLFGFSANPPIVSAAVSGQVNIGDALRNLNIHIHPGTPIAAGGPPAGTGTTTEDSTGEAAGHGPANVNRNVGSESGPIRGLPSRTVVAAIPTRSPTETSGHVLSVIYPIHVRTQQSSSTVPVSAQGHGPTAETASYRNDSGVLHSSESATVRNAAHEEPTRNRQGDTSALYSLSADALPTSGGQQSVTSGSSSVSGNEKDAPSLLIGNVEINVADGSHSLSSEHVPETGISPSEIGKIKIDDVQSREDVGRQKVSTTGSVIDSKILGSTVDTAAPIAGSGQSKRPVEDNKLVPLGLGLGGLQPKRSSKQSKSQGKDEAPQGLPDGRDAQSIAMGQQVLQSLVSQVDARAGVGSSAGHSTSSAVSGRAQHVHGQHSEMGGALLGLGRGQGGFDISRMFQQMMPVLSQALGGVSASPSLGSEVDNQVPYEHHRTQSDRQLVERIDIQQVLAKIQHGDSATDIFRAMLESARQLSGKGKHPVDLVNVLSGDEELVNEFLEMLQRHIRRQAQSDSGS
ncbi:hypothetical protein Taro_017543 [Colocasia esculenta]|uniref:Ubiquitin-like domain-containing protein n=1 Tax=Colocasia esculenta TaxID=4460 RepID=A0A843UGG1_COLES|nr:hypothetical protein [Colocasia esculenta]